jgi:hypothetical protein
MTQLCLNIPRHLRSLNTRTSASIRYAFTMLLVVTYVPAPDNGTDCGAQGHLPVNFQAVLLVVYPYTCSSEVHLLLVITFHLALTQSHSYALTFIEILPRTIFSFYFWQKLRILHWQHGMARRLQAKEGSTDQTDP